MVAHVPGLSAAVWQRPGWLAAVADETGTETSSIVIVIPEDPPSFNAMISDTGYDALVMELVLLGLTDLDSNGNVITELAAGLPSIGKWRCGHG